MKKSFLTFAAIAMVFSFTSCKETPAESTEETAVEAVETPIEEVEPVQEEVIDTTSAAETVVEDTNTTTVE